MSDVVYMAMKNYHAIASNRVFESPSAPKFFLTFIVKFITITF